MVKNIMAIGSHPDDVEVGCFGTLLRHIDHDDNVIVVITTKGGYLDRSWELICSEIRCAEKILGVEYILLENPIANYEFNRITVKELDDIVENYDIDTIYCNWYADSHQDHQATFKNTMAVCRKKRVKNLYCYGLDEYTRKSYLPFKQNFYVDITKYLECKLKAMRCYNSYSKKQLYLEAIKTLARQKGILCGVEYAEAFNIIFEIWR